jgi:hypothetical protein
MKLLLLKIQNILIKVLLKVLLEEIFLSWLDIIGGDLFVKFFFSILLKDNQLNYKILYF